MMHKLHLALSLTALLGVFGMVSSTAAVADKPIKVVYHVNDVNRATAAMRNINNHLNADPSVKIVVVTHSKGIDFLLEGAEDKNGNPYNIPVEALMARGVQFDVCNNTLKSRKIDPKRVLEGVKIVPSGVAEIARLQAREGYVYIKP
jgi:intracellular sulfur oxidation DsrE/DsrF family protein